MGFWSARGGLTNHQPAETFYLPGNSNLIAMLWYFQDSKPFSTEANLTEKEELEQNNDWIK